MKRNYINIVEADLDQSIYRIFSRERFIQLYETKKLVLVKPKKWEDPFENFIMNATGNTRLDLEKNIMDNAGQLKERVMRCGAFILTIKKA